MGLNIQGAEFWELRPDNFITMYLGYRTKQQQEMYATRRLMLILSAANGGKLSEERLLPLPLIDEFKPKLNIAEQIEIKKSKYTAEYIKEAERKHKERVQRALKNKVKK